MQPKRLLFYLFLAFLVFFLVKEPAEAARLVRITGENAGDLFTAAASAFTEFLKSLV